MSEDIRDTLDRIGRFWAVRPYARPPAYFDLMYGKSMGDNTFLETTETCLMSLEAAKSRADEVLAEGYGRVMVLAGARLVGYVETPGEFIPTPDGKMPR